MMPFTFPLVSALQEKKQPKQKRQQVLVVGRGVYALPILRILGSKSSKTHGYTSARSMPDSEEDLHITFGTSVGWRDMGCVSRFVDKVIDIPRPDHDLKAFTRAICDFVRGKDILIIPVVEETLFLAQVADIIRKEAPNARILTSSPDVLLRLNEKYAFQKAMSEIHPPQNIPQTTLVKNQKDAIQSIRSLFQGDNAAPFVVIKPTSGHGGIGAHIISRHDFEVYSSNHADFQQKFPLNFSRTPYVVQEFVEGHELSTFSLIQSGIVVAHVCYRPRNISTHGFSPIRSLTSEIQRLKTLQYVQKVASTLSLTGNFGFDFMQRYNGDLVALECNPRVTNGMAFFSPRFSKQLASQMKRAYYLSLMDPIEKVTFLNADDNSSCNLSTPSIISLFATRDDLPRHIMTLLPTLSCIANSKTNCEAMQLLELYAQAYDDVWWWQDPLPCLIMLLRMACNLLHAIFLSVVSANSSVTDILRRFVVSEVVTFEGITEMSTVTKLETVGSLFHDKKCSQIKNNVARNKTSNTSVDEVGLKVLITGATGFLGGRIVQVLHQGFDNKDIPSPAILQSVSIITATGRNEKKGQELIASLETTTGKTTSFVVADLTDAEETFRLVQGHDIVIHSAALCALAGFWDDFFDANVIAAENIVHACHLCGVRLLVHVSTPSVCVSVAPNAGDTLNFQETDPLPADDCQPNRYSVTKKIAESIVVAVTRRHKLPCIIIRPRALFGPKDTTLFPVLLDRLKRGRLRMIDGRRDSVGDFTYVDNVVNACLCCLDKTPLDTKIYSITNDDPRKFWDVVDQVCVKFQIQPVQKNISWLVGYAVGWMFESVSNVLLLFGFCWEPTATRYGIGIVSKSVTFDISAAKQDLDYKPVVAFDDGLDIFFQTLKLD